MSQIPFVSLQLNKQVKECRALTVPRTNDKKLSLTICTTSCQIQPIKYGPERDPKMHHIFIAQPSHNLSQPYRKAGSDIIHCTERRLSTLRPRAGCHPENNHKVGFKDKTSNGDRADGANIDEPNVCQRQTPSQICASRVLPGKHGTVFFFSEKDRLVCGSYFTEGLHCKAI